ncbi:hypothetical protein MKQ68_21255 [Chitinophaga horti]|uniref:DUF4350 domain-containing protein n=1 Tax=Chitinophaga horti TaxID=2920382 RepID=A0ABY6IYX0_9BACT|nr:DUF4350 domain-containing protein [Chitinophaga horti]UYQ92613.1 hypothetical protein MKQ68_21255 [Chitinophaga horti]
MKKNVIIFTIIGLAVLLGSLLLASLAYVGSDTPGTDRRERPLSLAYRNKDVYGGYMAHQLLPGLFKGPLLTVTKSFSRTYENATHMKSVEPTAYVLLANRLYTSDADVEAMKMYVEAGHQLFIAASDVDSAFMDAFNFSIKDGGLRERGHGLTEEFVNSSLKPSKFYYPGSQANGSFDAVDTAVTNVLGLNANGDPNFVRITRGNGQLFLCLNPYVFTNYFLSRGTNRHALEHMMAYMREDISTLYWDEYYKHQTSRPTEDFSNWSVLMRYPAMRWAFMLALLLLLLFVLFESKRRQRIIPVKPPLANTSLEFVKTLGALYFSHHNNLNLAHKMSTQFLEYVRNKYNLNTSVLDEQFIHRLSRKSNHSIEEVSTIIRMIDHVRLTSSLSDQELTSFYKSVYHFYQKTN